ncbi:MAG: aminotransferase class V-fold PLP-dependent enzyme [Phycisphaeraceae bacterium]
MPPENGHLLAAHWRLDPAITFLNHGSFGACPKVVLEAQQHYRDMLEAEPVRFFTREAQPLMDKARAELALLLGADSNDLAFVNNATTGVNCVVRSLRWEKGDEILTTDHAYNACRNVLVYVAQREGAKVVTAAVPFPLRSPDEVLDAILRCVSPRTKLALIDHVTSPTGVIFPIEAIVRELQSRGIDVLVDGAHAPGMVPLDLKSLNAAYYTGNCHKWLCAPKGAAFLHVRPDRQEAIVPMTISHGLNTRYQGRSLFRDLFDWTGTQDVTPWLAVTDAIEFVKTIVPGGAGALMNRNRELALRARAILCAALEVNAPCPASMIGSLASVPLPDMPKENVPDWSTAVSPSQSLNVALMERYRIEVPIPGWPRGPKRLVRISAQAYNEVSEYEALAAALRVLLAAEAGR